MKTKKQGEDQAPATAKNTSKVRSAKKIPVKVKPVIPVRPSVQEKRPEAEKSAKVRKRAEKASGNKPVASEKPTVLKQPIMSGESIAPENAMMHTLGFKKEYLNSHPECNVTFRLPSDAAPEAKKVTIVGDFNYWDMEATPMKKAINGDFTVTLELGTGKEYRFRYLIDGKRWENDWRADKYMKNPYGTDDSVVCV
jgi:hypothetical protein